MLYYIPQREDKNLLQIHEKEERIAMNAVISHPNPVFPSEEDGVSFSFH